jgi:hypothetical protein
MLRNVNVFIGSSSEWKHRAKDVQQLIQEENAQGVRAIGWWDEGVFPPGTSFLHALFDIAEQTNAALLVAGPDDITTSRGEQRASLRDNVLLEYGLFAGVHGQRRVALALLAPPAAPEVQLPSDLAGIAVLRLNESQNRAEFLRQNRGAVRGWIDQISAVPEKVIAPPLPLLWQTMLRVVNEQKQRVSPEWAHQIDKMASEFLEPIVSAFGEDYGINDQLTEGVSRAFLPHCSCLRAVDVLGPRGWISPTAYRYLARQIREYISRNTESETWSVIVSESVAATIRRAADAATKRSIEGRTVLQHSLSEFHGTEGAKWRPGTPRLEFVRILLWSRQELLSSVAESMIAIHEAFYIPLFFKETPTDSSLRDYDYLYFELPGRTAGFYGSRQRHYETETIHAGVVPFLGDVATHFRGLLDDSDILLATDARQILRAEITRSNNPPRAPRNSL